MADTTDMGCLVDVWLCNHLPGVNRVSADRVLWCALVAKWHKMYGCYVVKKIVSFPILFGWFWRVPSLHGLVFIQKTF